MPVTEAEKILPRIREFLERRSVLDLGCGMRQIVPWAVGIDDLSETKHPPPGILVHRIDPTAAQISGHRAEVVFSSHAIEHMRDPILETLRYWLTLVVPGGRLILYLPDERRYIFDPKNPKSRNPGHTHYLTPETFRWHLDQLPLEIEAFEEDPQIFDRYSFLVIARKGSS